MEAMLHPAGLLDMIQIDETARECIAVGGGQDAAAAERDGILVREVVVVLGIQDAVCKRLAGADAEEVAGQAGAVGVDVVQRRPFLGGDAGAHRSLDRRVSVDLKGLVRGLCDDVEVRNV